MRVIIATVAVPFIRGGAEVLAEGLRRALVDAGHETELLAFPFKWYPPERMLDQMLAARLFDLSEACGITVDVVIGLKFPAYYVPHKNKRLWLLHQHRGAYDLWDHQDLSDLKHHASGAEVRQAIIAADRSLIPEAKVVCTISKNVTARLKRYCGIDSTALYHPPQNAELFHSAQPGEYLLYPSRVSALKRQDLVLEALALTKNPVRVRFVGSPDYPPDLQRLQKTARDLRLTDRVQWTGWLTEEDKVAAYATALAILFPTLDEDYGYVTLEGMLSEKPVITCTDSGGPTEFVVPGETGFVTEPSPSTLAAAMDQIWENRGEAARMGRAGRQLYDSMNISWDNVVRTLLA
jgi:glycosyltransferase involved in cell wall biosynthesis